MKEVYKQTTLSGSGILHIHGKLLMALTIIYGSQKPGDIKFTRWIQIQELKQQYLIYQWEVHGYLLLMIHWMFSLTVTGRKAV
jgi:hypothetical protein